MTEANVPRQNSMDEASATAAAVNQTPLDVALDAIVYDVHPACNATSGQDGLVQPTKLLFGIQTEPAKYKVPERFGMSAILGIMTALAILFGVFHVSNAEPIVYLFFGLQTLVICVVQMLNGRAPRFASVIVGLILGPFFMPRVFETELPPWGSQRQQVILFLTVFGVPMGALLGYLTGACAAGIFLVMDYLEPYLHGYTLVSRSSASSTT
jgi:hypothetical protein